MFTCRKQQVNSPLHPGGIWHAFTGLDESERLGLMSFMQWCKQSESPFKAIKHFILQCTIAFGARSSSARERERKYSPNSGGAVQKQHNTDFHIGIQHVLDPQQ